MNITINRNFNIHVGSVIITDVSVYLVCAYPKDGNFHLLELESSKLCDSSFDHLDDIVEYLEKDAGETIVGMVPSTECTLTV